MTFRAIMLSCLIFVFSACKEPGFSTAQHETNWSSDLNDQVGNTYEIRWTQKSENSGNTGSTGSSNSRVVLVERVIGVDDAGLILEFDLPAETTDDDRKRSWQYPARVRKANDNSLTLLNSSELKRRNDEWLKLGNFDQSHCGLWFFTWIAQKIECDPNSIIPALEGHDIRRVQLKEGAMYKSANALALVPLTEETLETGVVGLTAELEIDPEIIRLQRAESEIVVAQILGEKVLTLEEAIKSKVTENISGSIHVSYELDARYRPVRRIRKTNIEILLPDGSREEHLTTETVERELLSRSTE